MDIVSRNPKQQLPLATSLAARNYGMDNIRVPENAQLSSKLCMAILRHDNTEVKELIRQGAVIDYQDEPDGWTPLQYSIYYGNHHARETLLTLGADIELTDFSNRTALMFAAITGNAKLLKELLQRGAKVDSVDCQGKNALDFAQEYRQNECITILKQFTK
ncbi:MAG: ankyrin repeat domain-containing protein [Lentisphaerae bacterium]|nr:ankyrin repeat domain-containing protein [Lentisphaerota bacterium]